MKAVVIAVEGGPEVLEVLDRSAPFAGPGEVVIGVRAVAVGHLDVLARAHGAAFGAKLPRIPGSDAAGVVLEVGAGVTRFAPGDRVVSVGGLFCRRCDNCRAGRTNACEEHRVVGVHVDGGDAERVALPADVVEPIPIGVDFDQAAAMAASYPVAWNLLHDRARLAPGETVLVMGAGGALGIAGVLIARLLGARVIAAAGSESKLERVRDLLAPEATVDYSEPGWADGLGGVDVVYENISDPDLFAAAFGTLRPFGRVVTAGAHGGGTVPVDMRQLYLRHLSILGGTGASAASIRDVFAAVEDGALPPPPVVDRFPLEEIAAAHEAVVGRDHFGRVIVTVE